MNKALTLYCLLLGCCAVSAQAPLSIPYQAVARNSTGIPYANRFVSFRLTVHDGSSGGTNVYQETDTVTTNTFGLLTVNVGLGTVVSGTFSGINWNNGLKYLQLEIDTNGGSSYVNTGTMQMLSVPYALYATGSLSGVYSPLYINPNDSLVLLQSKIDTVGTVVSGVWAGTPVGPTFGGDSIPILDTLNVVGFSSFIASYTGCVWIKVHYYAICVWHIYGISNSTTMSFDIPNSAWYPPTAFSTNYGALRGVVSDGENNGIDMTSSYTAQVQGHSIVIYTSTAGGSWVSSGTKGSDGIIIIPTNQ